MAVDDPINSTVAMTNAAIEALDQIEQIEEEFRHMAAARGMTSEQVDKVLKQVRLMAAHIAQQAVGKADEQG